MSETFTIAHLSDLHLGPLPTFGMRHWTMKRALGYANWRRNRQGVHRPDVAERLIADMRIHSPDHIAVTGDLINIGLPDEYAAALGWLEALGSPDRVSVVPGNHDIYVRLRRDLGVGRWQRYMTSDDAGEVGGFPYVRQRGRVALIGLNSAVPTAPFVAAGQLGDEQLGRLALILDRLGREGRARVVLIHHPPLPGQASRMKALRDADALAKVLARHGAALVLHGHNHRRELRTVPRHGGPVLVVGVPSISMSHAHKGEALARYHLFRFTIENGATRLTLIARGLAGPDGPVVEIERLELDGAKLRQLHAGTT